MPSARSSEWNGRQFQPLEVSKVLTEAPLTMTAWLAIVVPVGLDIKALTRATGFHKTMERPHGNSTRDGFHTDRLGRLQQGSRWREKNPWYYLFPRQEDESRGEKEQWISLRKNETEQGSYPQFSNRDLESRETLFLIYLIQWTDEHMKIQGTWPYPSNHVCCLSIVNQMHSDDY